ncbi:hypothetical protein [Gordonia sp. NPDC003429]
MTQPSGVVRPDPVVLGVSVVGDEIASVVRRADPGSGGDEIIASNMVDLPDASPGAAVAAIRELIESAPFPVDEMTISCAQPQTRDFLAATFRPGPGNPAWYAVTKVEDLPPAMAAVARANPAGAGAVAVVNLDRRGAPAVGTCIALIDQTTGEVLGVADHSDAALGGDAGNLPVTDPQAAGAVAGMIARTNGGGRLSSVVCTGAGAELPGVAPALEYSVQRPVIIADMPALALSAGAASPPAPTALIPVPRQRSSSSGLRWWLLGAAIGLAVLLGAIGLTALVTTSDSGGSSPAATPSTVTVTGEPVTVTRNGGTRTETETATVTDTDVRTTTERPPTVTRTEATTVTETETETQTETRTEYSTTTVTVPQAGGAADEGGTGQN